MSMMQMAIGGFAPDSTPDAFTFTDVTGQALSSTITSNTITVTGINVASAISITGGTYSVNGGGYASSPSTVSKDDTVTVRVTSSASYGTAVNGVLTVGGVSDTFTVTTFATVELTNTGTFQVWQVGAVAVLIGGSNASPVDNNTGTYAEINGVCSNAISETHYARWDLGSARQCVRFRINVGASINACNSYKLSHSSTGADGSWTDVAGSTVTTTSTGWKDSGNLAISGDKRYWAIRPATAGAAGNKHRIYEVELHGVP